MVVDVVPITRIRRDTTYWSYQVPAHTNCHPGSLVVITFRGREHLGVVWQLSPDSSKASLPISRVVSETPLIKAPHRQLIEYLSLNGLCSLSTALYIWLPRSLRKYPLSKNSALLLEKYRDQLELSSARLATLKQYAIISPSQNFNQINTLKKKFSERFTAAFADQNEAEELEQWLQIASGSKQVVFGRERSVFAPWLNLKQVTLLEPENLFYYHDQIPYLNLREAAEKMASTFKASLRFRSNLPTPVAQNLWGEATKGIDRLPNLTITDLSREPLLNDGLIEAIKFNLHRGTKVLILYNQKDKVRTFEKEGLRGQVRQVGIETLGGQLAARLNLPTLPESIILGTRAIFQDRYTQVGLCVALSIDSLLDQENFADQLHGWADLGHLFSYEAPCILQGHNQHHPLMQALLNHRPGNYMLECLAENQSLGLPPYGQQIVCSANSVKLETDAAYKLFNDLSGLVEPPWQLSHPLEQHLKKESLVSLVLHSPQATDRLNSSLRHYLTSLPKPWKVKRNPPESL